MRGQDGFTLVELLVVMTISVVTVGVVPLAYGKLREAIDYQDAVRTVATELRTARFLAVSSGQASRFDLNLKDRQFGINGQMIRKLPDDVEVIANVASREVTGNGNVGIVFLPEGGATGGSFKLMRRSGGGATISVDWLTGQISNVSIKP
jgi:general secretion pathway protein H